MTDHKKMKDHEAAERPVEKCMRMGPGALSDAELLAVIIRSGSKDETAVELAEHVLGLSGNWYGLQALHHLSMQELRKLDGIGNVKAVQLHCLAEIARRIAKVSPPEQLRMREPSQIAEYFLEDMRHKEREELRVVFFDTRARYIRDIVLFQGTVNSSLVSPREVFVEALKAQAVFLCLMHNHPSGDPSPSGEDLSLTAQVEQAGKLIGIELADHIIMGDQCYFSFRQYELLM